MHVWTREGTCSESLDCRIKSDNDGVGDVVIHILFSCHSREKGNPEVLLRHSEATLVSVARNAKP